MNRIDAVLAVVFVLFALRGFWRGFSREFFGFIGLIGGLVVAAAIYGDAVAWVPDVVLEPLRPIVAFVAVFFLVDLAAGLLGAVVHRMLGVFFLSPVNRVAGAVFGVVKGAALAAIALLLVRAYAPSDALRSEVDASRIAAPLLGLAHEVREETVPPPAPERTLGLPAAGG